MLERKAPPAPFVNSIPPENIQAVPPVVIPDTTGEDKVEVEAAIDELDNGLANPTHPASMNDQQLKARFLSRFSWAQVLQMFLDEQRKSSVEVKLAQLTLKLDVSLVVVQEQTVTLGFDPRCVSFSLKPDTEVTLVIDKKEMRVIYAGHQISIPGVGFNLLVFFFPSES